MPDLQFREVELRAAEAAGDLIPCVLATETPVERGNFLEVLSCAPRDVDLTRAPLPLIVQHDHTQLNIGVVEQVRAEGGKLRGLARFGSSAQAKEIFADVLAGIVRSLSVGYELIQTISETGRTVRFAWRPYECSVVSVPADHGAGFFRSMKGQNMTDINVIDNADHGTDRHTRSQRIAGKPHALNERERVQEIYAMGRAHNMQALAERAVNDGTSIDAFRSQVLDSLPRSGTLRPNESPDIGLTPREAAKFSFQRAILAQTDANYARRECGFELEASRAMAQKLGKEPQGLYVPNEVLRQQRDLVVGTPANGGYMVGTDHMADDFITLLRKRCHVMTLGAKLLGDLVGNVTIPSQAGAGTAFWVAENGAVTESAQTFGQVPLTPKTVGAFTDFSRRMLKQSTPDIESIVRADLAALIAVEVDRVAIAGTGLSNQPTGILGTNGIGSVAIGTNGGPITWAHVLQLEEALATANADMGAMAYLTNTKVRRSLKGSTKVSGDAGAGFIWSDEARDENGFGTLNGYKAAASGNVPSDLTKGTSAGVCSAMIFGNFEDLLIGQWGGLDVYVDQSVNATSGGTRVVALLDLDIAVRRAASFAAILDATTA